jgi:hypothetical protein
MSLLSGDAEGETTHVVLDNLDGGTGRVVGPEGAGRSGLGPGRERAAVRAAGENPGLEGSSVTT